MFSVSYDRTQEGYNRAFSVYTGDGQHLFVVTTAMSHCCGANSIEHLSYYMTAEMVDKLVTWMKTEPWGTTDDPVIQYKGTLPSDKRVPYWHMKHFFFFLNADYTKGDRFPLVNHPNVKLVMSYPSASERGHNINMYMLDLS